MSSVARQVARWSSGLLAGALIVAGVGTAAALHAQAHRSLDRALLAAAHGGTSGWSAEHSRAPVETFVATPHDPRVPGAALAEATAHEEPVWVDAGGDRLVLLTVEDHHDRDHVIVARAPRVTLAGSVGPFGAAYAVLATLAAVAAGAAQRRVVRDALAPVDRARDEAARVVALGQGARLSTDAPDEVAPLLLAINALLDRLDDAFRAQSRFTAEAAHELRTPVTAMLGELDVALRQPRSAESLRATLVSTREEVDRLRRLVDGLTTLARLDAGAIEGHREPVRASELAYGAVQAERATFAAAPPAVTVTGDVELDAHRVLLEAALANLLRNAVRHGAPPVTLTVHVEDGQVRFDVDDAGPGVPPAEREALFDRFARSGEARRRDRDGLGLGLPLAREVARRHGGDVVLLERPGGGTRARLAVPAPTG